MSKIEKFFKDIDINKTGSLTVEPIKETFGYEKPINYWEQEFDNSTSQKGFFYKGWSKPSATSYEKPITICVGQSYVFLYRFNKRNFINHINIHINRLDSRGILQISFLYCKKKSWIADIDIGSSQEKLFYKALNILAKSYKKCGIFDIDILNLVDIKKK